VPQQPDDAARHGLRVGLIAGIAAYGLWGLFPLYWPLLEPATPLEILADRFAWSFVFLGLVMTVTRTWGRLRETLADRRAMWLLLVATVLIAVNWGVYIWAVNAGHVVEAALGYFINPLVFVLLGTFVLGERLRRLQWVAVGIAAIAVLVLTLGVGGTPWVALILAFSWSGYGLVKKVVGRDPLATLTIETAYATPLAVAYLVYLQVTGALVFGHGAPGTTALLALTGVVTAVPLVLFGAAANRVPLSTLGVLQYLTPTIQFVIGVTIVGEHMPLSQWVGFAIVWLGLIVFIYDGLRYGGMSGRRFDPGDASLDEVDEPV